MASHEKFHGIKVVLNCFETGHGKGPCDGQVALANDLPTRLSEAAKSLFKMLRDFMI